MNTILLLQQYQITNLYNSFNIHKSKEKNNMILEPLQGMIQLALLCGCKVGTKLTIYDNILYLQQPTLTQPINRWLNSDKKDDLYFLFPVIKKFLKWFNPDNKKNYISAELYNQIITMSIKGLINLMKTYETTDNISVIQVINMYIELLSNKVNISQSLIDDKQDIDDIFEKITNIYKPNLLNIVYNTLLLIEEDKDNINIINYINGLNQIMEKNNKEIQSWIKSKLLL
jgi:hypothetical protein